MRETRNEPAGRSILELLGRRPSGRPGLLEAAPPGRPAALAPALLAPGRQPITFAALLAQIKEARHTLARLGVSRSDRVAVIAPDGPEMAAAFLGIAATAACAPLNPRYRAAELDFYLGDLEARALVVHAGLQTPARDVAVARHIPVIDLVPLPGAPAGSFTLEGPAAAVAGDGCEANAEDIALILHTSGTTSRPKMVPLTHTNLAAGASNVAAALALSSADRCLGVMPLFHIHGLVGVLLSSLAAGGSVYCTEGFDAERFLAVLVESRATWYSAAPTMHQAVLGCVRADPRRAAGHRLRLIRSSSAPLPPAVMVGLEEAFGVPVIEAYGMTEAAHQMASNPLPPAPRKPGSVGPAAGPEVAVLDAAGRELPAGEKGEIAVRGANVTHGYLANPEANAKAFSNGWFRTGDEGFLDAGGYLFISGRLKELINRGGEKIAPREIDEALLAHPAVAQALAFAVPHPTLGEDVAAAVVRRPGSEVDERTLQGFVAARLAEFKVPRRVIFLDEIPKGPTGKPQRIGLASRLGVDFGDAAPAAAFVAPMTPLEKRIAAIWEELLGVVRVGRHDDFFALGGDSLRAMQVVARVYQWYGVEVPVRLFFEAPTLATFAAEVVALGAREDREQSA